jgi:hypothetical protein
MFCAALGTDTVEAFGEAAFVGEGFGLGFDLAVEQRAGDADED